MVALLRIVAVPVADPVADGANCTVTVVLWLGDKVTAPAPLAIEKPVPEAVTPEIATLELPVLVMVKPCEAVLPSVTVPKLRLPGLTLRA